MAKEVKLPKFGTDTQEGTVLKCLVKIGDKVEKGDMLFEIETDKVTLEMESPDEGFVKAVIAEDGQTVDVGATLMILGGENEEIDMNTFVGKSAHKTKPACSAESQVSSDDIARITPEKMLWSKQKIPCFYLSITVDITELEACLQKLNETSDVEITVDDFIIKALALGFEKWPIMTGRFEGDSVKLADSPGIGFSISDIAPVIKAVNKKNLVQIVHTRAALIARAEAGKLTDDDLTGGCMTVSNLGLLGIDSFIPIVFPGQCSILGVGRITDTCVWDRDKTIVRKLMKMTIAVDHKTANGAEAAQFFSLVAKLLEEPEKLI
ncbi:MAG: 2-oxo acid dehydrogenase subunit E2 [Phycisphaerae bacterium]|nr:2-oxo acid dehydrogenase subunit E2 [Phycisphaerae bacterium]